MAKRRGSKKLSKHCCTFLFIFVVVYVILIQCNKKTESVVGSSVGNWFSASIGDDRQKKSYAESGESSGKRPAGTGSGQTDKSLAYWVGSWFS